MTLPIYVIGSDALTNKSDWLHTWCLESASRQILCKGCEMQPYSQGFIEFYNPIVCLSRFLQYGQNKAVAQSSTLLSYC